MKNQSFYYTLMLTAGAALPLAFAPFSYYFVAFLAPAIFLYLILKFNDKPGQSFLLGWIFGLGLFGVGASWVYISIYTYGNAPAILAAAITLAFIATLALFPALNGYILSRFFPKNNLYKTLLIFPLSWVIIEWLRGWVLTGFPWLYLGYTQINSPLKNIAPILGVYGVSLAVVFTSSAIISLFILNENRFSGYIARKIAHKLSILVAIIALWLGAYGLEKIHWTKPVGERIQISLIQGNVPLEIKWDSNQVSDVLATYRNLAEEHWRSKLIVWPEAAVPVLQQQAPEYLSSVSNAAKKNHSTIITGILHQDQTSHKYYNAMLSIGTDHNLYLKKHLVPFGEFLPFKSVMNWILDYLHIPWSDFSKGPKSQPEFIVDNITIAPFICYEIAYPIQVAKYFPRANLIVTISEDSWFGRSIAAAQQLEISQMRSLETGRYQLVVANSGKTAIIGPDGKIEAKLPAFQQAILSGEVAVMQGTTPWVRLMQ